MTRAPEYNGAEAGTRTPTGLRPLDPEPSASTSSATSAVLTVSRRDGEIISGENFSCICIIYFSGCQLHIDNYPGRKNYETKSGKHGVLRQSMIIYRNLAEITQPLRRPVITIGNFDGVHLGHQTLFQKVQERARAVAGQGVVLTFDPHPIKLMRPEKQLPLLTTTAQKVKILSTLGLEVLIVHPFTAEFGALPARDFVQEYLVRRLGVQEVVIGHDYRFGRRREGNIALLQALGAEFGFPVHVVDAIQIDGQVVSSTLIRTLIQQGQVHEAQTFLGRPYEVTGTVVPGYGRGARLLGFPTANIALDNGLLMPGSGIYAVWAELNGRMYSAVANIGTCPTFDNEKLSLEVYILDFDEDIYGARLAVRFVQRLRDEHRFPDIPALVTQIKKDVAAARQIVGLANPPLASL